VTWPAIAFPRVPVAPALLMRQVDREAQTRFGIEPRQLMEVAGFQVARFVEQWLGSARGKRITVVAGAGNNGGDALVAARFLAQRGAEVSARVVEPRDPQSLVANHARSLRAIGIPCLPASGDPPRATDLIVDGLLGTGISLPLREPAPTLIHAMNQSDAPIVAIDLPSGLESDSADGDDRAVQAVATITLGLPKPALAAARCCGRVFLADIGLPAALFGAVGEAARAIYREGDLLELVRSEQAPS